MLYEGLHHRFGGRIAERVRRELTSAEFKQVGLGGLARFLESRAEIAHKQYQVQARNALTNDVKVKALDALHLRWHEAESLAYLVSVAENVSSNIGMSAA